MEKVTSLRAANANLQRMVSGSMGGTWGAAPPPPLTPVCLQNARLKEENQVFRSTEDVLLRDNQRMKLEVQELRELQETLQDDLYVLEEQLWRGVRSHRGHERSWGGSSPTPQINPLWGLLCPPSIKAAGGGAGRAVAPPRLLEWA
ncbi:nanos homolog 2 isoform X3 [Alligator mississippiensis]|uniref:nanos homolog 2 isoform X3 n=1 Tax=Alligator mississippiensis TaxID=8496 RepID=UPI002878101F|nr:nanos homolog 2 isoform X3 [Alligator mississippiensis]